MSSCGLPNEIGSKSWCPFFLPIPVQSADRCSATRDERHIKTETGEWQIENSVLTPYLSKAVSEPLFSANHAAFPNPAVQAWVFVKNASRKLGEFAQAFSKASTLFLRGCKINKIFWQDPISSFFPTKPLSPSGSFINQIPAALSWFGSFSYHGKTSLLADNP